MHPVLDVELVEPSIAARLGMQARYRVYEIAQASAAFRRSVARRGLSGILHKLLPAQKEKDPAASSSAPAEHPFDLKYGVQTAGIIPGSDLRAGQLPGTCITGYYGTAPSMFRQVLQHWLAALPSSQGPEDYIFIDVGAGQGRVIMLASQLPFKQVIGIELDEDLVRGARRNLARWNESGHARTAIHLVEQNAIDFIWPKTPLVVFLFHPFGFPVIQQLITRLQMAGAAGSSPLYVLYLSAAFHFAFDLHPAFTRLWSARLDMDEEDRKADLWGNHFESHAAYRLDRPCVRR